YSFPVDLRAYWCSTRPVLLLDPRRSHVDPMWIINHSTSATKCIAPGARISLFRALAESSPERFFTYFTPTLLSGVAFHGPSRQPSQRPIRLYPAWQSCYSNCDRFDRRYFVGALCS